MWELEAQAHQGNQHPVAEDQLVVGASTGSAATWMAAALVQGALVSGGPRAGHLGDQLGKMLPGEPGEDRIGKGHTGPCWFRHPRMMTVRPISCSPGDATINRRYRAPSRKPDPDAGAVY